MLRILITGFIFSMILLFSSCKHDVSDIDQLPEMSFSQDILPVFQTGCAISGCHDAQTSKGGKIYDSYDNIMRSVTPGNPDKSKAYTAMINILQPMPPDKPIAEEDRVKIRLWILQGANNN
ncbi:MAG TPA: hypothetical protein ENK91_01385 [Bacteroidetes bacterium]|nr:hypothetical protein [Bacteroidota bacterium]